MQICIFDGARTTVGMTVIRFSLSFEGRKEPQRGREVHMAYRNRNNCHGAFIRCFLTETSHRVEEAEHAFGDSLRRAAYMTRPRVFIGILERVVHGSQLAEEREACGRERSRSAGLVTS